VLGRGALIGGVGLGAWTAAEKFADGDFVGGTLEAIQAALSTRQLLQACFIQGTQLETINGWRRVESLRVGEKLLSRDEHEVNGAIVESVIEEVFVRTGKVVWLILANGARIGTTLEHPFFEITHGWTEVAHLKAGSELALRDGSTVRVEALVDNNEYAEVYNFRIAGTHTYFVGGEAWGFSVWAHNTYLSEAQKRAIATEYQQWRNANPKARSSEFFGRVTHPGDGTALGSRQIRDIKGVANNDPNWVRPGSQRGPQPRSAPAVDQRQNFKIAEVTERLEGLGHEIRHGGRRIDPLDGKPVKLFPERDIPGMTRTPDITAYGPVGPSGPVPAGTIGPGVVVMEYHYNIGPNKSARHGGGPTKVEQQALDAMRGDGHTVFYEGYGQRTRR
jgi:hypothetical protein